MQELQLPVNALPLSVPVLEPSVGLKERILASIQPNNRGALNLYGVWQMKVIPRQSRWQKWSTNYWRSLHLLC